MNPHGVEDGPLALCHADGLDSERRTQTAARRRNEPEKPRQTIQTILHPVAESPVRAFRTPQRLGVERLLPRAPV